MGVGHELCGHCSSWGDKPSEAECDACDKQQTSMKQFAARTAVSGSNGSSVHSGSDAHGNSGSGGRSVHGSGIYSGSGILGGSGSEEFPLEGSAMLFFPLVCENHMSTPNSVMDGVETCVQEQATTRTRTYCVLACVRA